MRDFSNLDEAFLRFYQKHIDQPVTLDDESWAITRLIPEGKSDQVFYTLAVFKKTQTSVMSRLVWLLLHAWRSGSTSL